MNIKLQARANLSGNRIDLDWTWRTAEQASARFRLLRRERRYPVDPGDGVAVLDLVVPVQPDSKQALQARPLNADCLAPGSSGSLTVTDDPDSGDCACIFSLSDAGLAERTYYYALFIGEDASAQLCSRTVAMVSAQQQPDFSRRLYGLLPGVYRAYDEPSPADREQGPLRKYLEVFGEALGYVRSRAEGIRGLHDILQTRSDLLPHLAQWIGWDLDLNQDETSQRMEILFAPELYRSVGTLPNLQALVHRVTGWNCRIKEFVHQVCRSNAPETIHQWDIWEVKRNAAGNGWLKPVQRTTAENYDTHPACVQDTADASWLFWEAYRNHARGIACQQMDIPGFTPRQLILCPQDDPDSPLQNAAAPSVITVGENLWLFAEAGPIGKREIWWTAALSPDALREQLPDKTVYYPARNLSQHPADDRSPAAVNFKDQVWLFWQSNRRGPTDIWARVFQDGQWGPPKRITTAALCHHSPAAVMDKNKTLWLFYCEDSFTQQGFSSRLCCLTFDGQIWQEREDACTEGPSDESPAAVACKNKIGLFWHARDEDGRWQIWSRTFDGKKWGRNLQVTDHPAMDKEPAALVDANGRVRVFWRSQRRSSFHPEKQPHRSGYPLQSCTVDTRNTEMITDVYLGKESFENHVHYTYDTRVQRPAQPGRSNDAWCGREMVGVYLTPDILDAELITQGQELVKGLIQRFLPLQTKILFIIEPPVILEKVYTYDFPGDEPQRYIADQYTDTLERIEQYDGPDEGYVDTLPDWIWVRAWQDSCPDHRTVDTEVTPPVTRYRTWQTGLKGGCS